MTIALVAASLEIVGGQGVEAALLVRALRADGHHVIFVPINPRLPAGLRWLRRFRFVRTIVNQSVYLPSLLRLRHAAVVHVFSASYWSFLLAPVPAMLAARVFGKRVILHYHSGEADDHLANWRELVHPWLRLADEIIVPSEYLRRVFGRYGYTVGVIPNIVDLSAFRFRERQPLRPHLLSTRNLEPYYDVATILKAFALVKTEVPLATLTVAGSGSEEGRLRELAGALKVDGVWFVGRVDPSAMPKLCNDADVFLNASILDNQPVSILEACASGLPIVSTPTGDLDAMLRHGENALIVPPGDPAAMARAVLSLLEDPNAARAMAKRGRQDVDKFTWPCVRNEWARAYQGLTDVPAGLCERASEPS
jgi:glycosyltransferase involved in cell wall biosynthesis